MLAYSTDDVLTDLLPLLLPLNNSFYHGVAAPTGRGPPLYQGFMITLRHTTLGRTPLDE